MKLQPHGSYKHSFFYTNFYFMSGISCTADAALLEQVSQGIIF